MNLKPPPDRRKFANVWDQIGYLRDKLLFWFYQREDVRKARPFAERLEQLLCQADPDGEAILAEECRSLVHEVKGQLREAIAHREKEIGLIRRLHDLAKHSPHQSLLLEHYGYEDLSDRLDLLAVLYRDLGHLGKALAILQESQQLCATHGLPFDGADLLQEYLAESSEKEMAAWQPEKSLTE